jgi:hypothetical protein
MTYKQWRETPEKATQLAQVLQLPIVQEALSVIEALRMSNSIYDITAYPGAGERFFGYDAGRDSALRDLKQLSIVPSDHTDDIEPDYGATSNEQ